MAYGKDDFIDFNELNLEELLGEFTSSEVEFSDEDADFSSSASTSKTVTKKTYECDKCQKTYKSISGLRGHLQTKHGITNVRASDYRPQQEEEKQPESFRIEESEFKEFFQDTIKEVIESMQKNQLRKTSSGRGRVIIEICAKLSQATDIKRTITTSLLPHFYRVFQCASASTNTNEKLYATFHQLTQDLNLSQELQELLLKVTEGNTRPFVGVFLHTIMRGLIKNQSELFKKKEAENVKPVDENDQVVLFYISGYIISTLARRSLKGSTSPKLQDLEESMAQCLQTENDSEKTFVTKYSAWTNKANRGGLKIPSDAFFLLIRECEMCCREEISETSMNKDSLRKTVLMEKILDRFMVKHYSDKIFHGE